MPKRKTAAARRPAVSEVTVTRAGPAAWQAALMLAGGDVRRLRVLDARTVLVVNQAGPGNGTVP